LYKETYMSIQDQILHAIDAAAERVIEVSRQIHDHPELRFQEHFAATTLTDALEAFGIAAQKPTGGLETAFRAEFGREAKPKVAILAEYDALPNGHACGHNLIAGAALGAAVGLAAVRDQLPGQVVLLGTPGEEGGGGKVILIENGAFADIDAAMMFHPYDRTILTNPALAHQWVTFTFHGKNSHAAAAPWDGYSALSGVIQTFNLIDNARLHFRDGTRIHGIITDGGKAVNIIPQTAQAMFSVRALKADYLPLVAERVITCAEAAALATGTQVETSVQRGYKDMRDNLTMARRFGEYLRNLGVDFQDKDPTAGSGSTDMGDVSYAVPSIHPYMAICDIGESMCHQDTFVECANRPRGYQTMLHAAKAMALTAYDLLTQPDFLAAVKAEWEQSRP
jgi:amidohydrolase